MLATECGITFIQWKARIQEVLLCDLDRYTLATYGRHFMLSVFGCLAFFEDLILC